MVRKTFEIIPTKNQSRRKLPSYNFVDRFVSQEQHTVFENPTSRKLDSVNHTLKLLIKLDLQ